MVKNDLMFSLNLELNWSKKIDIFLFSTLEERCVTTLKTAV